MSHTGYYAARGISTEFAMVYAEIKFSVPRRRIKDTIGEGPEVFMVPDISYLILNYNPDGELLAEEVLLQTIDVFYSRKSKKLVSEVYLINQGSIRKHQNFLLEQQNKYKFSLLHFQQNIGIGAAINFIASGEISIPILFLADNRDVPQPTPQGISRIFLSTVYLQANAYLLKKFSLYIEPFWNPESSGCARSAIILFLYKPKSLWSCITHSLYVGTSVVEIALSNNNLQE